MAGGLSDLRFNYETELFHQIRAGATLREFAKTGTQNNGFRGRERLLLGNAAKITPALIPELHQLYQNCLNFVGGAIRGDLYAIQRSDHNAFVYVSGSRYDIVLSSALVREFKPDEIAFVIGHELGHVIYEHHQIPVKEIFEHGQGLPLESSRLLFQWQRAAEISADRIGLLCSGSLSSAANVFFKTSSGLVIDKDEQIVESLRAQYHEIRALARSASRDGSETLCTHPLIPIRFKSLEIISREILALRAQKPASEWKHADAEIQQVLLETELGGGAPADRTVPLLLLCLLYVASSDKVLNHNEELFICDIQARMAPSVQFGSVLGDCKRDSAGFMKAALEDIIKNSADLRKEDIGRILQLCFCMALSDGRLSDFEVTAMETLSNVLGGDPFLIDSIIGGHARP